MAEVEAIEHNGLDVVSTFSGCGGSCLGYRMAGCRVLWASEFVEAAQRVYKANHPDSILDTRDIRDVEPEEILDAVDREAGEIDILDGSPPCADFSTSGNRDKNWGEEKSYSDTTQRNDDLFFEYARILEGLQPKAFVAENVSGLVRGKAKGYFKSILRRLKRAGYTVQCRLLDSQWLGVPQRRKRLIFVGVRNDLDAQPQHPDPLDHRYTTEDVLPHIEYVKHGGKPDNWKRSNRMHPTITQTMISPTGYLSGGQYVAEQHPDENFRNLSIDELRVLFGFPLDFELSGDFEQRWERIARSVPPPMMKQIAATIRDEVLADE